MSGRGQGLVQHEPERHLAGERWRDDWAVTLVSAAARSCARVFGLVALQWWALLGGLRGHAWLHAESGGRGQVLALDEPERHLAGERWRDDWAVTVVSTAARSCARVIWFGCSAVVGVAGWLRGHAWPHAESAGREQEAVLDEPERYLAGERWRDDWAVILVSAAAPSSALVFCFVWLLCSGKRC